MTRPRLLIATGNPGKVREVAAILQGLDVELQTLDAFPNLPEPVEDADTFEGNARKKALYYAQESGQLSLADDSGLEVDALHGAPGVHSARYALMSRERATKPRSHEATKEEREAIPMLGSVPPRHEADHPKLVDRREMDAANNAKLIAALRDVPDARRTARFRCVVALARPGTVLAVADGVFEGRIIDDPRGQNGFGYDPHFFVPEYAMTAAQMPPALKNSASHRAKALAAIRPRLVEILRTMKDQ